MLVVYAHYPLPVIAEPDTKPWQGFVGAAQQQPKQETLLEVLTKRHVTAVLSGHLHSAFGRRVHRLHATPGGGACMPALHPQREAGSEQQPMLILLQFCMQLAGTYLNAKEPMQPCFEPGWPP